MGFGSDGDQSVEMMDIHMYENSKESSQYLLTNRLKVLREWYILMAGEKEIPCLGN